jgi:hypothetical protein
MSCAAKAANTKNPKRTYNGAQCIVCRKKIKNKQNITCSSCVQEQLDNLTLEDVMYASGPSAREAKWSKVRNRARSKYKDKFFLGCENCTYKKHVEVAHLKPIADFPISTKVSEVNSEENISILCRNCHWELDHDLMEKGNPIAERARILREK